MRMSFCLMYRLVLIFGGGVSFGINGLTTPPTQVEALMVRPGRAGLGRRVELVFIKGNLRVLVSNSIFKVDTRCWG